MSLIIKYIATVDIATGVIESVGTAPGANLPEQGIIQGSSPVKEVVWIPSQGWEGIDNLQIHEEYYRKDEQWVHRGPRPTPSHIWDTDSESWVFNSEDFWNVVRAERNKKLAESDWTQTADSPLHDSVKAAWRNYRTQLRDLPSVQSGTTTLSQIEWPEPPDGTILEVTPLP